MLWKYFSFWNARNYFKLKKHQQVWFQNMIVYFDRHAFFCEVFLAPELWVRNDAVILFPLIKSLVGQGVLRNAKGPPKVRKV